MRGELAEFPSGLGPRRVEISAVWWIQRPKVWWRRLQCRLRLTSAGLAAFSCMVDEVACMFSADRPRLHRYQNSKLNSFRSTQGNDAHCASANRLHNQSIIIMHGWASGRPVRPRDPPRRVGQARSQRATGGARLRRKYTPAFGIRTEL